MLHIIITATTREGKLVKGSEKVVDCTHEKVNLSRIKLVKEKVLVCKKVKTVKNAVTHDQTRKCSVM
jgi:hypothetical protein